MKKKLYNEIKGFIQKYNLKPTTQRNLPLLTQSIITIGYTIYLKKRLGYSYEAIAFIGKENYFQAMMGEEELNKKTEDYIEKNRNRLDSIFSSLKSDFYLSKENIIRAVNIKNQKEAIKIIIDNYTEYMRIISTYNCFWRYMGNREDDDLLPEKLIQRITKERDEVAKFYPEIETMMDHIFKKIGENEGYDGNLLRYLSYFEFEEYLKNGINKEKIRDLIKRKIGYFYIFVENGRKELITTDKDIIMKLKKEFFEIKERILKISGFSAQKGFVRGTVFNILESKKYTNKGYILVAHSTHPKDIEIIKNSKGMVVDEGGILSHAAVISRELKIPCVIGTKIATKTLKDGDYIEVDANRGIVEILKRK